MIQPAIRPKNIPARPNAMASDFIELKAES
jgi:hypothetical protein